MLGGLKMMMVYVAVLCACLVLQTSALINRRKVVSRHNVEFEYSDSSGSILNSSICTQVLTVGNGEIAFTADLTGLQSLNNSCHIPNSYPLLTQSNWGWHSPDPVDVGVNTSLFKADGTLNYVYENVSIVSSDNRPGKGNRTVPYQFNCANYNNPAACNYFHTFPARINLGQLSFVLPRSQHPSPPPSPTTSCTGIGEWCNTHDVLPSKTCTHIIKVSPTNEEDTCNASASCQWKSGWHNAPFCVLGNGEIKMSGVTPNKANFGYFDGSCDRIQWNNTFDTSSWCRSGSNECSNSNEPTNPKDQPAGPFKFLDLSGFTRSKQSLDMYSGILESSFTYKDSIRAVESDVSVTTVVDSESDSIAVQYTSEASMELGLQLAFCPIGKSGKACEWDPDAGLEHATKVLHNSTATDKRSGRLDLSRQMGSDSYAVSCAYSLVNGSGEILVSQTSDHSFAITGNTSKSGLRMIEIVCRYESLCCVGPNPPKDGSDLVGKMVPPYSDVQTNSVNEYNAFWNNGAFADIAGMTNSSDAFELERRTIQSMYLLRSQESGSIPPQESALLYNSWTGKHHSEMRYWHQTWMPIWGHPELLAKSDQWFIDRLTNASYHTKHQGYNGCRWGKMLGESNMWGIGKGDGSLPLAYWESPNNINPGLVWHQPHVIYMAELEYRASSNKTEVLDRLQDVVFCTADFIADFPERKIGTGTNGKWLDLGPPLVSASEGEGPYDVWNPTYELTQFNFSLDVANMWLERLGKPRNKDWDDVRANLAPLPVSVLRNGTKVYNRHQNCLPSVFEPPTQHCSGPQSHPALNGALGCLPSGYGVDMEIMNNTLFETLSVWGWDHCWGWDQPMVAMTATRLGLPDVAISTLLMHAPTNTYAATGYNNPGREGSITGAYLPGNGGTLIAIGLMAGGWEGAEDREAPGFPVDWGVKAEGFTKYF